MTAFIWVHCSAHPPYRTCHRNWRYDVTTVDQAMRRAVLTPPDPEHDVPCNAPDAPLTPQVVLDCQRAQCSTRLCLTTATDIYHARQLAARTSGWSTQLKGDNVRDFCRLHTEA